jgi:hypothetical protein
VAVLHFKCSSCQTLHETGDGLAGKKVRCQNCNAWNVVPRPAKRRRRGGPWFYHFLKAYSQTCLVVSAMLAAAGLPVSLAVGNRWGSDAGAAGLVVTLLAAVGLVFLSGLVLLLLDIGVSLRVLRRARTDSAPARN